MNVKGRRNAGTHAVSISRRHSMAYMRMRRAPTGSAVSAALSNGGVADRDAGVIGAVGGDACSIRISTKASNAAGCALSMSNSRKMCVRVTRTIDRK